MSFPYLARTTLKYKSPHATDLSFAKDEIIRVTGPSPDDEDWLVGETLDGSKSGGFPKDFIIPIEGDATAGNSATEHPESSTLPSTGAAAIVPPPAPADIPPVPASEPAPPSPKLDPATLPPTSAPTPAPAPAAPAPATSSPAQNSAPPATQPATAGDDDEAAAPKSMKDRLAFFAAAQNKAAPPPPTKPKPQTGGLTWSQRQKLRQEQEAKERADGGGAAPVAAAVAAAPAAPASTPAPGPSSDVAPASKVEQTDTTGKSEKGAGLSAADAASSIGQGGSLKERMAALRAGGAFGAPAEEKTTPAVKPSGKVWSRPAAPPQPDFEEGEEDEAAGGGATEKVKSPSAEEGDPISKDGQAAEGGEGEEQDEQTEEEQEKARRAAIAARMAKLGARGPMGMALPPKPARKPTRDTVASPPAEERSEPVAVPVNAESVAAASEKKDAGDIPPPSPVAAPISTAPESSASPPTSVPIPAVPRRAAPPRRRGPTSSSSTSTPTTATATREDPIDRGQSLERTNDAGEIEPPPQVMVADEEKPIPKTEEQLQVEHQQEDAGRGPHGAEGAEAAGISLSAVPNDTKHQEETDGPLVGAVAGADSNSRGVGTISDRHGGEIVGQEEREQEVEEGIAEGGPEKDDIIKQAQQGNLLESKGAQPVFVPLHSPAAETEAQEAAEEGETPPPPPPHRLTGIPRDEVELKREHEAKHTGDEDPDAGAASPPQRVQRLSSSDRPLGPRPLPSPIKERGALPPPPTGSALIPPRDEEDEEEEDEEDDAGEEQDENAEEDEAPPPPPRQRPPVPVAPIPAPEGHERHLQEEEDEDEAPPPPPRRQSTLIPPIPISAPVNRDEQVSAPEADEEEEGEVAPPPPQRKATFPAPIQTGLPTPAVPQRSPSVTSPTSPRITRSPPPTSPRQKEATVPAEEPAQTEEEQEKTRRSGIAARMAKLGGIKFGMPPPTFKKSTTSSADPTSPTSPVDRRDLEEPTSPIDREGLASPKEERTSTELSAPRAAPVIQTQTSHGADDDDESPEAEAARRRKTLARLRAGGALGFGVFNNPSHQDEEPQADERGLQEELPESSRNQEEEGVPPPPPPGRPAVPGSRAPISEEEDAPPPPPPGRPSMSTSRPSLPPPPPHAEEEDDVVAPPPPSRPSRPAVEMPASPIRSPSGRRPPVPGPDKRLSLGPTSPVAVGRPSNESFGLTEEPAILMMNQNEYDNPPPPPPPGRPSQQQRQSQSFAPPPIQTQTQVPATPPHRTMSNTSRTSRVSFSGDSPARAVGASPSRPTRQESNIPPSPILTQPLGQSQGQSPIAPPQSAGGGQQGGGRPGYDQLVASSRESGSRLARAARAMFDQGKKAYYGDGSPAGFVFIALENAHLPRPAAGWGQVVYEQDGASVLKRYDEPRPGDIAAFHDAKLKGRKGLQSYDQHVGSVEEPLLAIVVDFEQKNKHKLKALQVERGVPEEVSYRFDDLKSGKVVVYRVGL